MAPASVVIGIIIAILELRNLIKARQTDLVVNLYTAFNTREFREADMKVLYGKYKDYDDFVEKHGSFASQKPIRIDRCK